MNRRYYRIVFATILAVFSGHFDHSLLFATDAVTQQAEISLPGVFGGYVHAHWTSDGSAFWYESFGPNWTRKFWWVDAVTGKKEPAFDHEKLAAAFQDLKPDFIVLDDMQRLADGTMMLNLAGSRFIYNPATNEKKLFADVPVAPRRLQPMEAVVPSSGSSEETTVTFVNPHSRKGSIWTIDTWGNQTRVGDLESFCQEFPAFTGTTFVVKDEAGNKLGIFQAAGDPSQAVIDLPPSSHPSTTHVRGSQQSPDQKWVVSFEGNNIVLGEAGTERRWQLTSDGLEGNGYSQTINEVNWSPDSSKFLARRRMYSGSTEHIVQSSPDDRLEPRLHSVVYVKAVDAIWSLEPHLFDATARHEIRLDHAILPNQFVVRDMAWNPDSQHVNFSAVDRGSQWIRVARADVKTGKLSVVFDERSSTFVDVSSPEKSRLIELPKTGEFIWTSERDGWNHAYLYDSASGQLKNQITRGSWVIRGFVAIHPQSRTLVFRAGGLVAGEDPYNIHVCRINFDGTGLVDLTPADGSHSVEFSPDGRFYLDTYSRVDLPTVTELRRGSDAGLVCKVDNADWNPRLATGWMPPERFVAKGRDGKTDVYGVIYRPSKFDPEKKYPVIEEIYAGPHTASVPKQFIEDNETMALANLGFVVVAIDGMGTNYRSKEFHDVCWHNLADAGFPDRILWMKAAAAKHPEMDLTRVGIFGASRGAENAVRALESHGDFYSVAVATCGIYDDRLSVESEQWMGWPVGPWYAEQSNVTGAANINGKLLLISCELDRNVDPSSTMQMVNAMVKSDKDFDLLIIPNADHGEDGRYGLRRRREFFVRHLIGESQPRK